MAKGGWFTSFAAVATLTVALLPGGATAFQVLPRISDVDRKLTNVGSNQWVDGLGIWLVGNALPMIKNPVHEAITLNALDCVVPAGNEAECLTQEAIRKHQVLLYGVRWPDDPPFRVESEQPTTHLQLQPRGHLTLDGSAEMLGDAVLRCCGHGQDQLGEKPVGACVRPW